MQSNASNSSASALKLSQCSTLTLELAELRNRQGVICAALFAHADGYPNNPDKAIRSGCFPITELPCLLVFPELPFGVYAAAIHHDENMDGKLNCNPLGIPKEGIGFSGDPRIWKGMPAFERCQFQFSSENTIFTITMKYLLR